MEQIHFFSQSADTAKIFSIFKFFCKFRMKMVEIIHLRTHSNNLNCKQGGMPYFK